MIKYGAKPGYQLQPGLWIDDCVPNGTMTGQGWTQSSLQEVRVLESTDPNNLSSSVLKSPVIPTNPYQSSVPSSPRQARGEGDHDLDQRCLPDSGQDRNLPMVRTGAAQVGAELTVRLVTLVKLSCSTRVRYVRS